MSDQPPERPDDVPDDDLTADGSHVDLPVDGPPSTDSPPHEDADDVSAGRAAPVDHDLTDREPAAAMTEPDDLVDLPTPDEQDAVLPDAPDDALPGGLVHDVDEPVPADLPGTTDEPDPGQDVPAPGDLDGPDGGVPPDVVHVDDDAFVRPLDAPLAHVLGQDGDDLSVLVAPADATDADLPTGAPDREVPTDAADTHASHRGQDEHAHDDATAPAVEDLSTTAWDEHAHDHATGPPVEHVSSTAWDEHADDAEPVPLIAVPAQTAAVPRPTAAADPAAAATGPTAAATGSGWSVLGRALKPRVNRAQVLAGVLCALLGFALAVQIRQTSDLSLSGMRQADLVRILDEATTRGDSLERERADLLDERDELLSGSDTRQAALDALRRSAETQGILAGRLPAEGRGVVVTVSDGGSQVKPVTMLNMLEELRNAGAEAMQLNDLRITASSAFTGTAGAIQLDGAALSPPYVWKVIGDPDTIATALQMPGGAFAEVRNNGGNASVEQQDLVEVSAIRVVPDPVHATPVPPAAG